MYIKPNDRFDPFVAAAPRVMIVVMFIAVVTGCGGGGGGGGVIAASSALIPPPRSSRCVPSGSVSVLIHGGNVLSYVPLGSWSSEVTGVALIQVEGTGSTTTLIPTPGVVNSCASNSITGQTVCIADNTDVYLLSGAVLQTLSSGGSGKIAFSSGECTNCSVTFNERTDQALVGLSTGSGPGYQFLDLAGPMPTFESPIVSPAAQISENPFIDPTRNLLLSAGEKGNFEIARINSSPSPAFFENALPVGMALDSSAEDCATGVALAPIEGTDEIYLANLSRARFTTGSPGTWSAPSRLQSFPELQPLSTGISGLVLAPSSHIGVVTGEFGGNLIGAIQLPAAVGDGVPSVVDYVACGIPEFSTGSDPHRMTAYVSPNTKDSMALISGGGPSSLAVVDLTKMLNTTVVPRTAGTHSCSASDLPPSVVSFVPMP